MDGWLVEYNGSGACMCVEQSPLHKIYKHVRFFRRHTPNEVSRERVRRHERTRAKKTVGELLASPFICFHICDVGAFMRSP